MIRKTISPIGRRRDDLPVAPEMVGSQRPMPVSVPGGGVQFSVARKTMIDLKFVKVVRQQHDLSCGAAAVATLLTYYYGDKVGEKTIVDEIMKFGNKEKIKKDGFSMLELKRYRG